MEVSKVFLAEVTVVEGTMSEVASKALPGAPCVCPRGPASTEHEQEELAEMHKEVHPASCEPRHPAP